jgi:hypothetical protein
VGLGSVIDILMVGRVLVELEWDFERQYVCGFRL